MTGQTHPQSPPPATLAIVIVNYRTPDLTIACLRSLQPEIRPGISVIVTDNASADGSPEKIAAAIQSNNWQSWAALLPLPRNGGFSYGNNRGIEAAGNVEYVLLLNSDTVVFPGVLAACIAAMQADPRIGVMSCLLENPDGSIQNVARKLPTPFRLASNNLGLTYKFPALFGGADLEDPGWDRRTVKRDCGWIGGAFMFIRASLLQKIGPLDEDFFFYGEDAEFCHRVWKNGFRVHYDPAGKIMHIGGASADPQRVAEKVFNLRLWKARYLLQRKLYGDAAALFVRATDILGYGLRSLKLAVSGKKSTPEYRTQRDVLCLLMRPLRG